MTCSQNSLLHLRSWYKIHSIFVEDELINHLMLDLLQLPIYNVSSKLQLDP